jgi:AcrR family transcriptional regulator
VALELIERDGYESLSLRSLAKALGVTAPAIYDHFDSKADVLSAVAAEGYAAMDGYFVVDGSRAIERCRQRAHAYVAFAQDRPEVFRVMFLYRPRAIAIEADNELSAASTTFEDGMADITRAIADGDLVDRDPLQINLTLWAAMHGVASIALMAPALASDVVDDVVDAMFRGLAR